MGVSFCRDPKMVLCVPFWVVLETNQTGGSLKQDTSMSQSVHFLVLDFQMNVPLSQCFGIYGHHPFKQQEHRWSALVACWDLAVSLPELTVQTQSATC